MTSTVDYKGALRTTCTHLKSGDNFETDAPVDNEGRGERFSPTDLLATSLGVCMITVMGIKARAMDIDLIDTRIDITKIMKAEPRRVGGIKVSFHFPPHLALDDKQRS